MNLARLPLQIRNTEPDYRSGYCRCGCGRKTTIPEHNDASKGWKQGVPLDWCNGHFRRISKRYEIDPHTGCWNWLVSLSPAGYGTTTIPGLGTRLVHILIYEILFGPVNNGYELDHKCRNRRCVNPDHMKPMTLQCNTQIGKQAKLIPDQVLWMREKRAEGWSVKALAAEFGVAQSTASAAILGHTWGNI